MSVRPAERAAQQRTREELLHQAADIARAQRSEALALSAKQKADAGRERRQLRSSQRRADGRLWAQTVDAHERGASSAQTQERIFSRLEGWQRSADATVARQEGRRQARREAERRPTPHVSAMPVARHLW